jgi:hypothetical protein
VQRGFTFFPQIILTLIWPRMAILGKHIWKKTESQTQYSGEPGKLIMDLIISQQ